MEASHKTLLNISYIPLNNPETEKLVCSISKIHNGLSILSLGYQNLPYYTHGKLINRMIHNLKTKEELKQGEAFNLVPIL